MAHASQKEAPLKEKGLTIAKSKEDEILERLGIELDPARKYTFQLAAENEPRPLPVIDFREQRALPNQKFKHRQNIVFTSQIVWNKARVNLRYYDGCETIFTSDQPEDKDVIKEVIANTQRRDFIYGKYTCYGYEKMLIVYLLACSWNVDSPYRTATATGIFKLKDENTSILTQASKLDLIEKAMMFAKEASETKMHIHASYLMIPMTDEDSGNALSPEAIRTKYREKASLEPELFIKSYTDTKLEVRYFIDKAIAQGEIKSHIKPNWATWRTGKDICDISGLRSNEAIAEKILEYSQTVEGEEFSVQLKALYN